jgi:hypothetical protein
VFIMRAAMRCACGLLLMATAAGAQERCTDTPPARICASELGPVRIRTVAELAGGDITDVEVVVPTKYAESPGFARAAGGSMLQLVPFSSVAERTGLFARLMKARHRSPVPWFRFGRYDWRAVERDGSVRVEATRMERK